MAQIRYDLEVLASARRVASKPDATQHDLWRHLHDESVYHLRYGDIVQSYLSPETRNELIKIIRSLPKHPRRR